MKILFLIQSHKEPLHLKRLVATLRAGCPTAVVLVSHDERAAPLSPSLFAGLDVHVIPGRGGRGDFMILDGYLSALQWLEDNKVEYDWLVNLSGSDYPVYSLARMENELKTAQVDGFLHHFDALQSDPQQMLPYTWKQDEGSMRYLFQFSKIKDNLSKWQRWIAAPPRVFFERATRTVRINTAYGLMIGRRARSNPFSEDFRCYAGSYWHIINARSAAYLLRYSRENQSLVAYFRDVLIPDESFIQTVLVNNRSLSFTNDNKRYFNMRGSRRGHPQLLTDDDVVSIVDSRYYFARKLENASGEAVFSRLDRVALA